MSLMVNVLSVLPQSIRDYIMPEMRIPDIKNDPSKIQLERLGHIYFEHPDLWEFAKFAEDFGFVEVKRSRDTIWYRGYGKDQYVYVATKAKGKTPKFGGATFVAQTQADFDKACKLPNATVKTLDDAPGGGQLCTIARPNDTWMHILWGQEEREIDTDAPTARHIESGPANTPYDKPRKGKYQRFQEGPAMVHKLGHFGYVCKEFEVEFPFYTENFNFVPSNILHHPKFSNVDVLAFMHLDLGERWSDHHCFFMQRAPPEVPKTFIHHSSFEVSDFDTQLLGHQFLANKGWESVWGVGRHILGSQIFDYWKDPSGFKIEHYADGDVVNSSVTIERDVAGPVSVWGPEIPKNFSEDTTKIPH